MNDMTKKATTQIRKRDIDRGLLQVHMNGKWELVFSMTNGEIVTTQDAAKAIRGVDLEAFQNKFGDNIFRVVGFKSGAFLAGQEVVDTPVAPKVEKKPVAPKVEKKPKRQVVAQGTAYTVTNRYDRKWSITIESAMKIAEIKIVEVEGKADTEYTLAYTPGSESDKAALLHRARRICLTSQQAKELLASVEASLV